eukprot:TRINITY_DN13286_c0_g2_i1.p1 TRINITY_DN13286_c0_g2~~TRINITY_DN13286_c0_g2_i1.p1  ORF type:complete len:348 (+),score=65.41 TRINITY_DN13286_c0_g2_i1:54-1046(+)
MATPPSHMAVSRSELLCWKLAVLILAASSPNVSGSKYMNCGKGVPLCGVLTLESGFGRGYYRHAQPQVHGLWPQVDGYGSSQCIRPKTSFVERKVYSCYRNEGNQVLWFENHEWTSHGVCAGAYDEDDFFHQVCDLSDAPLKLMEAAESGGFYAMVQKLRSAGYPIWYVESYNDQIELSACAGADGRWKLAAVSDFPALCGSGGGSVGSARRRRSGGHVVVPGEQRCVHMRRGPPCHGDGDCVGLPGCLRCARSGFCTDVPLAGLLTEEEENASPDPLAEDAAVASAFALGAASSLALLLCVGIALRFARRSYDRAREGDDAQAGAYLMM